MMAFRVIVMMTIYELIQEPTDTWAIFEVESGEPAMVGDRPMIGLLAGEAEKIFAELTKPLSDNKRSAA